MLARINDNVYKIDLPCEYNISATFNVSDLSLFDFDSDSKTNPLEEGANNVSTTMVHCKRNGTKDELATPNGLVTRSRVKKFKEALQSYIGRIVDGMESQETMRTNGIISNQMGLNLQQDSNSCLINYFK